MSGTNDGWRFHPRTPRGVRQSVMRSLHLLKLDFQSTHPARGATSGPLLHNLRLDAIFNPAPREGCDHLLAEARAPSWNFNPRTPARGDAPVLLVECHQHPTSIHAPREGCDGGCGTSQCPPRFQSTHPARVRLLGCPWRLDERFSSTHPARRDVFHGSCFLRFFISSIHAPREGATYNIVQYGIGPRLIHAPREGCDCLCRRLTSTITIFNPRTPRGCDRPAAVVSIGTGPLIHAPARCDSTGQTWKP